MIKAWSKQQKVTSRVWAIAFSAVVLVGSFTGALLKTDRQKEEVISQFRSTPSEAQIETLRAQKETLLQRKAAIETQMQQFQERVRERELEKIAKPKH